MPFHSQYADGSPRPLLRGWLHGVCACLAVPLLQQHYSKIPLVALPGIMAIVWTLVFSSLVHLVPYKSSQVLEFMTRLDKTGIFLICGGSFVGPQLLSLSLDSNLCKPSLGYTLMTVVLPITASIVGVLRGMGPQVFVGSGIAFVSTIYFCYNHAPVIIEEDDTTTDNRFLIHTLLCALLYGSGLVLYVSQIGGHKPIWGYHEWMHVLVTIGFLVNVRGLWLLDDWNDHESCCIQESTPIITHNTMTMSSLLINQNDNESWTDVL